MNSELSMFAFSDWRVQDISDLFVLLKKHVSEADVVVYCGDDLGRFQRGERNLLSELSRYVSTGKVLAVAGNDDTLRAKAFLKARGVQDLHEEPFTYGDHVFVGAEGSTTPPGLLLHSEEEIAENLLRLIEDAQGRKMILVSHTPPHRCLDYGVRFAPRGEAVHHIGSTAVRDFVLQHSPELVLCGHAHTMGRRTQKLGQTLVVNVSSHDARGAEGNLAYIQVSEGEEPRLEWHTTREVFESGSVVELYGIGRVRTEKLKAAGIATIRKLANLREHHKIAGVAGLSVGHLRKLSLQAKAAMRGEIYQYRPFPRPENPLFFDIETDLRQRRIWMIGCLHEGKFKSFYADRWEDEKTVLQDFLAYLGIRRGATLISFSGTGFDWRICEKAMERLGLNSNLFLSFPHLDLCSALRSSFVFPVQSFALKDLASALGFKFRYPEMTGLDVAIVYHEHVNRGTPVSKYVLEYNEDDVGALPFLLDVAKESEKGFKLMPERNRGTLERIVRTEFTSRGYVSIRRDKRWDSLNVSILFYGASLEELEDIRDAMASLGFYEGSPYHYRNKRRCYIPYYGRSQLRQFIALLPSTQREVIEERLRRVKEQGTSRSRVRIPD